MLKRAVKFAVIASALCFSVFAADDLRCFPLTGRTAIHQTPGHILDNAALPAGILADYKGYQLFLIRTVSNQKAAFLLLDYKKTLHAPKYLANMGGFFGTDSANRPAYVFAKGPFLAGVVGLPQEQADPIARVFAGRIPLQ